MKLAYVIWTDTEEPCTVPSFIDACPAVLEEVLFPA